MGKKKNEKKSKGKKKSCSEHESSCDESDDDSDDNVQRQRTVSNVVMTPIITPTSYVSSNNQMEAYNAEFSANMSSTTISSANTNSSTTNLFKSMPIFRVQNKRSLSASTVSLSPSRVTNVNGNGHVNLYQPPNKKAKLSAMHVRHRNPLLSVQPRYEDRRNNLTPIPLNLPLKNENIALPSLNAPFQTS